MKISAVLEATKRLSAWGEPIPLTLEKRKVSDEDRKLPKLKASTYGVDHVDGGSAE